MSKTLDYTEVQTLQAKTCPVCFVLYAAPKVLFERSRNDGGNWYCPNGHSLIFTELEIDRLKAELTKAAKKLEQAESDAQWERESAAAARKWAQDAENRARGQKAAKTKLMKRIANGVCPCCHRQFQDLRRHMATKHSDYVQSES